MQTLNVARALGVAAMLAGATAGSAATNLITNGSFELGTDPGSFSSLQAGNTAITGWTVGGAGVDYIGSYWQAADGVRSVDLSGSTSLNDSFAGSVSQTIATVLGQTYTVGFSLAGNPDGSPLTKVVLTSATNGGIDQLYASTFTVTPGVNTRTNMGWQPYSFKFTATGAATTINFQSAVNSAYGAALDNVSVTTAVPEPMVWSMLIGGFGMVGFAARRRQTVRITYA